MPRPENFTETVRRHRLQRRAEVEKTFRRAQQPTEAEITHDVELAANLVRLLGVPRDRRRTRRAEIVAELGKAISALVALFTQIRFDWNSRREINPYSSLPALGGIQPTH